MVKVKHARRVIGYVFDQPQGHYKDKYYFEGTAEKMATFIVQNIPNRVVITDRSDTMICETTNAGVVLSYTEYAEDLQKAISESFIDGNIKPLRFYEKYDRVMEEITDSD